MCPARVTWSRVAARRQNDRILKIHIQHHSTDTCVMPPVTSHDSNKSAKSGVMPSAPSNATPAEIKEVAKARLQETANMRVQRHRHAKNAGRCNAWGASLLRADARAEMKFMLSALHLTPVSMATRFELG